MSRWSLGLALAGFLLMFGLAAAAEPEVIEHENGLIVKIVKKSKSCIQTAKNGDELHVQYVGRLTNAKGKIFDQSKTGNDFIFKLGAGQVIIVALYLDDFFVVFRTLP